MKANQFDHVAIQVKDIQVSEQWYLEKYKNTTVIYSDETWAMLEVDGVKIALVLGDSHPPHLAIRQTSQPPADAKRHRDMTYYIYDSDPDGNVIERIWYPVDIE